MKKAISYLQLVARTFLNLKKNDPIRMAAATAFFAFFALPPIVIILSQLFGNLLKGSEQRVSGQLVHKLADLFGTQGAQQLQDISENLQQPRATWLLTVMNLLVLLLASTTLFAIIKRSIHHLWHIEIKKSAPKKRVTHFLQDKGVALGFIIFSGFLFKGSRSVRQTLAQLSQQAGIATNDDYWFQLCLHHLLSAFILTVWFTFLFRYLPQIRIRWKAVWVGGLVTALLVKIGEQVLDRLLINNTVRDLYGTSGALILVLLFLFYTSLIFYYGASFTYQYDKDVHPRPDIYPTPEIGSVPGLPSTLLSRKG